LINFFSYKINKNYIRYFLIFGWISCWASLSFNPYKLILFFENIDLNNFSYDLLELLDKGRGLFQLIYFPILVILYIILSERKKIYSKVNIFYFLFVLLFFIETYSTLILDNPNVNIYFIVCSFNVILTVLLLKIFFTQNEIFLIFNLSIIILLFLLIFFGVQYLYVALRDGINVYASWATVNDNLITEGPRPTGLARTALISMIFFMNIKFLKKPYEKVNFIIIYTSVALILLLSSRTIIFLYFLYLVFHLFYFKIYGPKNILLFLKDLILIPVIFVVLFGSFQQISKNYNLQSKIGNLFNLSTKDFKFSTKDIARDYPEIKSSQGREFTSGRLNDWKIIFKNNKNFLLGNGVVGDRYLINQSASNLIVYTYASSGLIGILIIISISLVAFFYACKNLFINKSKQEPYKYVASVIIIILILRSILETSYGVFGIDFILFCLCFSMLTLNKDTNESN